VRTEWVDRSHAWNSTASRPDIGSVCRIDAVRWSGERLARTRLPALTPPGGQPVLTAVDFGIHQRRSWRGGSGPIGSQLTVSTDFSGRLMGNRMVAREPRRSSRGHRNISVLTALSCGGTFSDNAVMARSRCHGPSVRRVARKRGSPAGGWRWVKGRRFVQR
jgi:hypothetical protein